MERWVGKTAIVTGASAGIGAAIALSLANAGVNVVGLARNVVPIEELRKGLKPGTGQLLGKKCDVSNREEISSVFAWVNDTFGGIHILVNNAGCVKNGTLTDVGQTTVSMDDIEAVLKLNVLGLLACSQEAVKYMKQTGVQGHIIHVSSMLGHYVHTPCLPMMNIYYGSKHAVRACTDAMRLEFAYSKTNIRVTSVSPAAVNTDFLVTGAVPLGAAIRGPERSIASLESQDVADAVLYAIATPPRVNVMDVLLRPMGDTS